MDRIYFVQRLKYLGVHKKITASKHFECCVKNVRMKFYITFNAIYSKSKGANSELTSVQLLLISLFSCSQFVIIFFYYCAAYKAKITIYIKNWSLKIENTLIINSNKY